MTFVLEDFTAFEFDPICKQLSSKREGVYTAKRAIINLRLLYNLRIQSRNHVISRAGFASG